MRYQRYISILFLFTLFSTFAFAQGLNTTASKEDWEEVNFEFNSPVLTDGYPSLLRLAELLQKHPDYKVKLEGHADVIGSNRYNERLGQRRADTVRDFLVKYGAGNGQITTATFGETQPKIASRTKEARFMNRRVFMTVTDGQGRTVLDRGGVNEAIKTMDDLFALQRNVATTYCAGWTSSMTSRTCSRRWLAITMLSARNSERSARLMTNSTNT